MTKILTLDPLVASAMLQTWDDIAPDLFSCLTKLSRLMVIECVLDANRLEWSTTRDPQAAAAIKMFREHNYKDQVKLAKLVFQTAEYR